MLAKNIIRDSFCLLNLNFCVPFVALLKRNSLKRITAAHLLFIIQSIFLASRQLQERSIPLYIVFLCMVCVSSAVAREIKQHSKQTDATFFCEWASHKENSSQS